MTNDLLTQDWKLLRSRIKGHWHALTDDDLKLIAGSRTTLANVLCEKYGYTEPQAQKEIEEFLSHTAARHPAVDAEDMGMVSAMSMLTFYINRAGENFIKKQRANLEAAKGELREASDEQAHASFQSKSHAEI